MIFPPRPASVHRAAAATLIAFVLSFVAGLIVCSPLLAMGSYATTALALAANSLLCFAVPGLVSRCFAVGRVRAFSGGRTKAQIVVIVFVLAFVSQFVVEWAAYFDRLIASAIGFSGEMAKASNAMLASVCDFSSVSGWVVAIVVIALLPAASEEVFFRGGLLPLLRRATGGWPSAVIISSVIFSAVHLDPAGFLSRTILGLILGTLFVTTRSIWPPLLFHFLNNALCVVSLSFAPTPLEGLSAEPETPDFFVTIFSMAFTFYELFLISRVAKGRMSI